MDGQLLGMIAEFANYQSWIAWVPIVGLLAVPLALRRVLPLALALVGSFVGFVAVSIAPPLGRNAEQLGAEIAIGLIGGAAAGALMGLLIQAFRRSRPRDSSTIVFAWAIALAILGEVIAGFVPFLFDGAPDLEVGTLLSIAVGGGLGWIAGTMLGWRCARTAPPPDGFQRSLLVVAAIAIALMGWMIVLAILNRSFGPSIDSMTRHERHQLPLVAALYGLDTAIAALTLLVLAVRRTRAPAPAIAVALAPS